MFLVCCSFSARAHLIILILKFSYSLLAVPTVEVDQYKILHILLTHLESRESVECQIQKLPTMYQALTLNDNPMIRDLLKTEGSQSNRVIKNHESILGFLS